MTTCPLATSARQSRTTSATSSHRIDGRARHVDARAFVELGAHEAGAQRVHADAGAAEAVGQPLGERDHPRLGRRVGRPAARQQPGDAGDVDHRARARGQHGGSAACVSAMHGGDVDVELRLQDGEVGASRTRPTCRSRRCSPGLARRRPAGRRPWRDRRRRPGRRPAPRRSRLLRRAVRRPVARAVRRRGRPAPGRGRRWRSGGRIPSPSPDVGPVISATGRDMPTGYLAPARCG